MSPEEMVEVLEEHIAAENRADVEGAVATYGDDCFYEIVALGIRFDGKQGVSLQYAALFYTFPDGELAIDRRAFADDVAVEWGTFSGTMKGEFMGLEPTGKRLSLPLVSIVTFRDGKMEGERVYYDIATVADQLGLDLEALRAAAKLLSPD